MSLGIKQLEENPWDVFETVFTLNSVHQGTILSISDKGAIISLPYGVEGFAPTRHLVKADGTTAKVDEALDFKVLEFVKDSKKIIVSHAQIHNDQIQEEKNAVAADRKAANNDTKKAVKKVKDSVEKTTLGDIEALSALRNELEQSENGTEGDKE